MKCKKYEEKIILHLYGELDEKERAELENHINECRECSRDFAYTKKVFKELDKSKREIPEANWEKCWREIDADIHKKPAHQKSYFFFPRWAYAAAALLLVFVLGAIIGRFLFFQGQQVQDEQGLSPSSIQFTLQEYFEELKPVLVEYANFTSSEKAEETILMDKEVAHNLLIQNILLKSIVTKTDPTLARLLDDVDIVLKEISNLKKEDRQTPSLIKELIHEREILFKLEILQKI
ncbi:MAG: hypothetical protein GTO16_09055 [Candidatus Aminicenantes bacterium]|nr:hypothetical protein [Candidatus Aminicenantes bacterium]